MKTQGEWSAEAYLRGLSCPGVFDQECIDIPERFREQAEGAFDLGCEEALWDAEERGELV